MSYIAKNQAVALGENCLNDLLEEMIDSFGSIFPYTGETFIRAASAKYPDYLEKLGLACYIYIQDGMTQRRQREAMERVASKMEEMLGNKSHPNESYIPTIGLIQECMGLEMVEFDFSLFPDMAILIAKGTLEKTEESLNKGVDLIGSVGKKTSDLVEATLTSAKESVESIPKLIPYILGGLGIIVSLIGIFYVRKK